MENIELDGIDSKICIAHQRAKETEKKELLQQKRIQEEEDLKKSIEQWKRWFSTSSIEEQKTFLHPKNRAALTAFCELNDLDFKQVMLYLKNKKKNSHSLLEQNPIQKRRILQEYQEELEEKIASVTSEMKKCLVIEAEHKKPAPLFNAYQYYLNNDETLEELKSIAKALSKEEELITINNYIHNHHQIFSGINSHQMKAYLLNKHMSCGDQEVDFIKQDFDLARESIEEHALPLTPIVLFGAISYQTKLRVLQESIFGVKKKKK